MCGCVFLHGFRLCCCCVDSYGTDFVLVLLDCAREKTTVSLCVLDVSAFSETVESVSWFVCGEEILAEEGFVGKCCAFDGDELLE